MITEGEFKAACGTKNGIPTIGLGGVWCFKSTEQGITLLPQFSEFQWKERTVNICYDSDAANNTQVAHAENALASELLRLGAHPFICRIPQSVETSKKVGLDDYIAAFGVDAFKSEIVGQASEWEPSRELFRLNEEVVYVEDPGSNTQARQFTTNVIASICGSCLRSAHIP